MMNSLPSLSSVARLGVALSLLSVLAGCGGGGSTGAVVGGGGDGGSGDPTPAGFDFSMWTDTELCVLVRDRFDPMHGVRVQVVDALDESGNDTGNGVYAIGVTDADGLLRRPLRVPSDRSRVDLVVHEPGHQGPYTHEQKRGEWGPTAPSSRVTVVLAELDRSRPVAIQMEVR